MSDFEDRRSASDPAELIADPLQRARREAENGIRQFEAALAVVQRYASAGGTGEQFCLTQDLILELHRIALDGIHRQAGLYRSAPVTIGGSRHVPPRHTDIPDLLLDMCCHVNECWHGFDAAELAAYALWRINWIHPFADGNGRTARIVAYMILSLKIGYVLPGSPTIPEQIADDRGPYYRFLEQSDDAWRRGIVAVSDMVSMIETMLERQLRSSVPSAPPEREVSHD